MSNHLRLAALSAAFVGTAAFAAQPLSLHGSATSTATPASVVLTVNANCEITDELTGEIDLGGSTPSNVFTFAPFTDADAKVKCTNTTPFAISVARSANLSSGANTIPYSFKFRGAGGIVVPTSVTGNPTSTAAAGSFDQATGTGVGAGFLAGTKVNIPFRAKVEINDYQNAVPGQYSDATLTMTVTW